MHGWRWNSIHFPRYRIGQEDDSGGASAKYPTTHTAMVPNTRAADVRRKPVGRVGWGDAFPAFSHRNHRIFFGGQMVSLTGIWPQTTAEGWLVYQPSGSSVALGFIRFATMPPFALWGGIIPIPATQ